MKDNESQDNFSVEELKEKGIQVKNIVAKIDINVELDLSYLNDEIPNSDYNPKDYPSLIFRPSGLATILITRSGIILFTGIQDNNELVESINKLNNIMKKIGIDKETDNFNRDNAAIVNTVSVFDVGKKVNLHELSIKLGLEKIEYEPEQFPGLIYRSELDPVVIIFSSGKIVITGVISASKLNETAKQIEKVITSLYDNSQ